MAPEIILRSGHGAASDWWSIGILLYAPASRLFCPPALLPGHSSFSSLSLFMRFFRYELLCGETPFNKGSPKATMALIAETSKDPYFPSHLSAAAVDIIKRLLTRDQAARLVHQHPLLQLQLSHACTGLRPRRRRRHQDPPFFQGD